MPLDDAEKKQITDLGAAIASMQADVDKLKAMPVPPAPDLKKFEAELAEMKAAMQKIAPAVPAKTWDEFLGALLNPLGLGK